VARCVSLNAEGGPSFDIILTALELSGISTLTRQIASVNAVFFCETA